MRLLVTGSSGQIGSYVVEEALGRGHGVVGLALRPGPHTRVGDIRSAADCRAALEGCDAVVHCAAQISVQASIEDPHEDADHNVLGSLNLLQAARELSVTRFVNVSSAAVYGTPVRLPVDEGHPADPLSPYGASKLAVERYVRMFRELHELEAVTVRPFNVYSPRQDPANPYTGVMSKFAARVRAGQAPVVFGDGGQSRDFVHARDVARWMVTLAEPGSALPPGGVVNLGTGRETTVLELARMFLAAAGGPGAPEHAPERKGEIRRSVADVALARKLGLVPEVALEDGVAELLRDAAHPPG